jgi:hypothetical protein
MRYVWYTKSLTDEQPSGLVHIYQHGDLTLCGKFMDGNGRWFVSGELEPGKATCRECIRVERKEDK